MSLHKIIVFFSVVEANSAPIYARSNCHLKRPGKQLPGAAGSFGK